MKDRIPDIKSRILFENSQLLVVDKPYDIPTAGKKLEDEDGLQFWLIRREGGMVAVGAEEINNIIPNNFLSVKIITFKLLFINSLPEKNFRKVFGFAKFASSFF